RGASRIVRHYPRGLELEPALVAVGVNRDDFLLRQDRSYRITDRLSLVRLVGDADRRTRRPRHPLERAVVVFGLERGEEVFRFARVEQKERLRLADRADL